MQPQFQTTNERLRARNEQIASKTDADNKHNQLLYASDVQRQTLLQAIQSIATIAPQLAHFMQNHTSKTEVVNQLEAISTPDALKVIPEIQALHDTLKNRPTTDLSEVARLLESVLEQARQIPKEHQSLEIPTEISVKNQLDYSEAFQSLEGAIKAIKTQVDVKPPVVNVKAPEVHVDAPDLTPLSKDMQENTKAVKAIKFPEVIETKQQNSLITEPFDEFRVKYEKFAKDEDDPPIESIEYYNKGKQVATIEYSYVDGRLAGAKRI